MPPQEQRSAPPVRRLPLPADRRELERMARQVARRAHAPYSGFRVGAAVRTERGIFVGCNVENASYGLALCAERSALAAARAAGARKIRAVAIVCLDADPKTGLNGRTPCGACRQWLLELAPEADIHLGGVARSFRVEELLPLGFHLGR